MFGRVDLAKIAAEIVRLKTECTTKTIWTEPTAALNNLPDYCRFDVDWPKDGLGQWETNIELRRFLNAAWNSALSNSDRDRLSKSDGGHEAFFPSSYYVGMGYETLPPKEVYAFYSLLVPKLAVECDIYPIEVEMALFAAAEQLVPSILAQTAS
jgi:hypothetical protein